MIEALKLALEALEGFIPYLPFKDEAQCNRHDKAIFAIKEALAKQTCDMGELCLQCPDAQPRLEQGEPVAYLVLFENSGKLLEFNKANYIHNAKVEHIPLYALKEQEK
jgi:hypothetical protein